jgi:hypothetical protein
MKFDASKLAHLARPRYFEGQLLTAEDFRAEQAYQREKMWQHNRLLHGYGIVAGLEVAIEHDAHGGAQVVIAPGYALDGWGRELIVYEPLRLVLGHDRRDFVVFMKYVESDAAEVQILFEPPAERMTAPTTRSDFAIPLARFRKPHTDWQQERNFRPPRAK